MNAKSAAKGTDAKKAVQGINSLAARRKWDMQRAAQRILGETRQKVDRFGDERKHYVYRVAMCHRGTDGVAPEIRRMPTGERAEFFGVQTCGSVWTCPICAARIASKRRDEMRAAMAAHRWDEHGKESGGMVFLATYTFQHTAEEGGAGCLDAQLTKLREAMRKLTSTRAYKETMEAAGSVGQIRAMEVTYGEINGWHPHVHQLIFANKGALEVDQRRGHVGETIYRRSTLGRIRKLWARLLLNAGIGGFPLDRKGNPTADGMRPGEAFGRLRALLTRCFTVQCGTYADDYIAKFGREGEDAAWGMADELAKGHTKTPRRTKHSTPWGLLCDVIEGDSRAAWLFKEYAEAFHGKAQLFWSRGLKDRFGIGEVANEEIAATPEFRCNETVIKLTDEQWSLILSRNARWHALVAAAKDGRLGVLALLRDLTEMKALNAGDFTRSGQAFIPIGGYRRYG